jgi:hypothetical protein
MTPKEVKGRIRAHERAIKRETEDADLLAWLIGHYAGFGFHDIKHYPNSPNVIKHDAAMPEKEMEESDIKDALTVFAKAHNAAERDKTHGNNT